MRVFWSNDFALLTITELKLNFAIFGKIRLLLGI